MQQEEALIFPNRMSGGRPFKTFQIDPAFSKYPMKNLYLNFAFVSQQKCQRYQHGSMFLSVEMQVAFQRQSHPTLPTLSDVAAQLLFE